jgi:RNA polymerase sigma-70 factor (ECF subfamily)
VNVSQTTQVISMDHGLIEQRLSRISTLWTVLEQAHRGSEDARTQARKRLLERYGGAVHRYLLATLRDPHAADDLTQEFALSLVRGDFHKVEPQRGRFRDYVKTVLFHLVGRHRKKEQKRDRPLPPDSPALQRLALPPDDLDRAFKENWRDELLARTWEALAAAHPGHYEVFRCRAAHPDLSSAELAQRLTGELGRAFTAPGVRQTLHRAREQFGDLLVQEVACSLRSPTAEDVEQELRELDLLAYCRPALDRYCPERPGG